MLCPWYRHLGDMEGCVEETEVRMAAPSVREARERDEEPAGRPQVPPNSPHRAERRRQSLLILRAQHPCLIALLAPHRLQWLSLWLQLHYRTTLSRENYDPPQFLFPPRRLSAGSRELPPHVAGTGAHCLPECVLCRQRDLVAATGPQERNCIPRKGLAPFARCRDPASTGRRRPACSGRSRAAVSPSPARRHCRRPAASAYLSAASC